MELPSVSIIIPCPPGTKPKAIEHIKKLDYPIGKYEIIVEEGYNPSAQRNRGIQKAKGEIVGFTDDDCLMNPNWLKKAIQFFGDESVGVVGGPNLTPENSSFLPYCFGLGMGSYFGAASMSTRYERKDVTGEITEQNLIFNNMFVKNEIFKKGLLLNEVLFPNEENEFLNRVAKCNYKLVYTPEVYVYHPRKEALKSFAKQLFGYGAGRAHQTTIQPDSFKILYLMPTIFVLGLLSLPLSIAFNSNFATKVILLCLGIYFLISIIMSLKIAIKEKKIAILPLMPLIFFIIHVAYGTGFLLNYLKLHLGTIKRSMRSFAHLHRYIILANPLIAVSFNFLSG